MGALQNLPFTGIGHYRGYGFGGLWRQSLVALCNASLVHLFCGKLHQLLLTFTKNAVYFSMEFCTEPAIWLSHFLGLELELEDSYFISDHFVMGCISQPTIVERSNDLLLLSYAYEPIDHTTQCFSHKAPNFPNLAGCQVKLIPGRCLCRRKRYLTLCWSHIRLIFWWGSII